MPRSITAMTFVRPEKSGEGTGFVFNDLRPQVLYNVVGWAAWACYKQPDHVLAMRKRAMAKRFSWDKSARSYPELCEPAVEKKQG
jgi:starch synthase